MAQINIGQKELTGRLADDPEIINNEHMQGTSFVVLDNHRRLNEQSQQWETVRTDAYNVTINAKDNPQLAANALHSLEKGQLVNVEGHHRVDTNFDSKGQEHVNHKIYARDVSPSLKTQTLARGPKVDLNQPAQGAEQQAPQQAPQYQPAQTPEGQRLQQQAAESWSTPPTQAPAQPTPQQITPEQQYQVQQLASQQAAHMQQGPQVS